MRVPSGPLLACVLLAVPAAAQCMTYQGFRASGKLPVGLQPPGTGTEVSGLAASRHNPGILWAHDDKGNGPFLLALRADGKLAQQYRIQGVANRDWEDIAVGPGPVQGRSYLYIGEIGNNTKTFTTQAILRVREPDVPPRPGALRVLSAEVFPFAYPGGPRDAETLLVDPIDGTPYVLTKEAGTHGFVYRYPLPLDPKKTKTVVLEVSFFHPKPSFSGGDFAPDGRRLYFRNRSTVFWARRPWGRTVKFALSTSGCSIWAGNQGNAEALAVTPDGLGLVATSEGKGETIWTTRGKLPPRGPATVPSWWCFGSGTRSASGMPGLGAGGPPILGKAPVTWAVFGGRPSAAAFLVLSLTGLADGKFAFAGGWVHVLPDIVFPLRLDAAGSSILPIGVLPDLAPLRGLALHGQAFVRDPTASQGVALSRGLTLRLDR